MEKYKQTCEYIKQNISISPVVGIILGSGLGELVSNLSDTVSLKYGEIPNFINSGIDGHKGNLVFGHIDNVPVGATVVVRTCLTPCFWIFVIRASQS